MSLPFATLPSNEALAATTLAFFMAVSAAIWITVYIRWQRCGPIIPLARQRAVPWNGHDVLVVFVISLLIPMATASLVQKRIGAEQKVLPQKKDLAHPAERLLRSGDPAAIIVAALMAVIVAPLVEEFLFRVVLQGWLEAAWSRRRRTRRELRTPPRSWMPVVLPAAIFALIHLRFGKPPPATEVLIVAFVAQTASDLLVITLAIAYLRFAAGVTAANLGWKLEKLPYDFKLGLWALLAVVAPLLAMQLDLMELVNAKRIDFAPDPIPLFFLALVFGLLYRRTHRIAPSLVLHMAFNATSVALFFAGS
jgi:membrane protease YdiL (CAAX protease family)